MLGIQIRIGCEYQEIGLAHPAIEQIHEVIQIAGRRWHADHRLVEFGDDRRIASGACQLLEETAAERQFCDLLHDQALVEHLDADAVERRLQIAHTKGRAARSP